MDEDKYMHQGQYSFKKHMELGQFKSQPWFVHDAVVAFSFLLGDDLPATKAIGTAGPAITEDGEMLFFAEGRLQNRLPWYTSLQQQGTLSYGFQCWGMSISLMLPPVMPTPSSTSPWENTAATSGMAQLANAIVHYGVMLMELGQEQQMSWPVYRFGAAGGVYQGSSTDGANLQNGFPTSANYLGLPEPIDIPRTQPLSAKIRLAVEVRALIGSVTNPGVGSPLGDYTYETEKGALDLKPAPFGVRFTLAGRRIKKTSYGQLPKQAA